MPPFWPFRFAVFCFCRSCVRSASAAQIAGAASRVPRPAAEPSGGRAVNPPFDKMPCDKNALRRAKDFALLGRRILQNGRCVSFILQIFYHGLVTSRLHFRSAQPGFRKKFSICKKYFWRAAPALENRRSAACDFLQIRAISGARRKKKSLSLRRERKRLLSE